MDAIGADEDVGAQRHPWRTVYGDSHTVGITPYMGYRRPIADPHPAWGHVLERSEGGALHVRAQQAQNPPAGKPGELAIVQAGSRMSGGVDILCCLDLVGHCSEPRVEADPLRRFDSRTKEVHHVALGARSGRFLEELDVPAGQPELPGRNKTRYARPNNHSLHDFLQGSDQPD
jgi:hypothetical protein